MEPLIRRTAAVVFAGGVLLGGGVTGAAAAPQGYDEVDHEAGRFYGNFDIDVLLFAGETAEYLCSGAPVPVVTARVYQRNDGGADLKVNSAGMPVYLYHSPLGAPEFIDETCAAVADGDPSTVPVPPFAVGTARFKERITVSAEGVVEIYNGVNGTASDSAGTTWKVRTWADFVLDDDGVPIGDPADFQGLALHEIGR
ncbi:hypothetical protein [uncultured Phycicoccus sp.]|uniref:hypothetical protein n=1 Tax=uncultured Phycicoccus sp. TaxID=661422 RepID=UPI00260F2C55|nr:hypothetical protein [uncultured Phycicoccus sp.]